MNARVHFAANVVVGLKKDLEVAREIFLGEKRGSFREAGALIGGGGNQIGISTADARDEQIADVANGFRAEVLEVAALALEAVNEGEGALGGLHVDSVNQFLEGVFGDDTEEFTDGVVFNIVAAVGAGLFEEGKGIAHAAFGHAGDDAEGAIVNREVFLFGDEFQPAGNLIEGEGAEMEVLRAGADGVFEIFRLGGGHDEDDAIGGLFESFEKSVGGLAGKHVGFVEDDDFVARGGRGVTDHFAEFADLVDAAIGGRVDFDDVERSAGGDFLAGVANAAGFGRGAVHAVEGFGEDAGGCGLANAAGAGKDVGVSDAIIPDGVLQSFRDVSLSDEISKGLRAPFASDDLVGHVCVLHFRRVVGKSQKQW